MKVIIAGGREFNDYPLLRQKCDYYLQNSKNITIICGKARGADTLGEYYAKERKLKIEYYPAKWHIHNKRAGFIRNQEMLDNCDAVICFWDGKSKGTAQMIDITKKAGKPLKIVNYG